MRLTLLCCSLVTLLLAGCDAGAPKIEAIDSQHKVISCALNGNPLTLEVSKGSLDATMSLEGKVFKVNLLEVKDFYQILMRFDANIGQLKINKTSTALIQLRDGQERTEACTTQLKSL